jgi:hypothetical protein
VAVEQLPGVIPADIEARWRPLSEAETDVAMTLIEDALAKLDILRPRLGTAVQSGLINSRLIVDVICDAVQRVLRNPDLLRAQNLTGDGGVGITYGLGEDTNHALPRLRFSLEDLAPIDAAMAQVPGAAPKVRSVRLVAP